MHYLQVISTKALRSFQTDKGQQASAPQQTDGWTQIAKLCIEVQQFFEAQDCFASAFLEFSTAINILHEMILSFKTWFNGCIKNRFKPYQ